jgi:hypothetical protein
MIELEVTMDKGPTIETTLLGLGSQMPFIAAKTLNITANKSQDAIQAALPSEFNIRRKTFIENTIYRGRADFATKDNLVAAVRVNPARDFLAKFEDGGEKHSIDGVSLAVPVQRMNVPNLIIGRGDPRAVKKVMALIAEQGGKQIGPFKRRGAKRAAQQSFFLVHSRKGQTLVMQRDAGTVRVLYAFEKSVPIKPQLHFEEIAMKRAVETFDESLTEAIEYAIATMR